MVNLHVFRLIMPIALPCYEKVGFVARGRVGDIAIKNDKSLISKLRGARGQRVGILRTDVPGKEYILRKFTRG